MRLQISKAILEKYVSIAQRLRLCMYDVDVFVGMKKVLRTNARCYQVILESAIVLTCSSIVRTGLSIEFSKCGLAEDILSEAKLVSLTLMARVSGHRIFLMLKARPACR